MRITRYIGFIIILNLFRANTAAQSPYHLSFRNEACVVIPSCIMLSADYIIRQNTATPTIEQIRGLAKEDINPFDRNAASLYSEKAAFRSEFGKYGTFGLSMGLSALLSITHKQDKPWIVEATTIAFVWAEVNLLNYTGTNLLKSSTGRFRPYAYNETLEPDIKTTKDARESFVSGHTSLAAANSFFMAKALSDYYPESRWKPLIWITAAAIPAWTGYERVVSGQHFPTDVIAGYALGTLCGILIPEFHRHHRVKNASRLQVHPYIVGNIQGLSALYTF